MKICVGYNLKKNVYFNIPSTKLLNTHPYIYEDLQNCFGSPHFIPRLVLS